MQKFIKISSINYLQKKLAGYINQGATTTTMKKTTSPYRTSSTILTTSTTTVRSTPVAKSGKPTVPRKSTTFSDQDDIAFLNSLVCIKLLLGIQKFFRYMFPRKHKINFS